MNAPGPNINDQELARHIMDLPEYVELPGAKKLIIQRVAAGHDRSPLIVEFRLISDAIEEGGE